MNNFAQTNLVPQDTTNLPEGWGGFSLELEIVEGLVGQILQIGFVSTASDFEGSGIFYDNVLVVVE